MGFKICLDDVEPWKAGGVILRPGSHPVRVVDEETKEPGVDGFSGDHPIVILSLEAIGGDEKGGEVRDWVHITSNALGRVAQIYEAFGVNWPSGEFEWISLIGKTAKVVVREKPGTKDPSKMFAEVAGYGPLGDVDMTTAAFEEAFDAKPVEVGRGGKKDDDIPF